MYYSFLEIPATTAINMTPVGILYAGESYPFELQFDQPINAVPDFMGDVVMVKVEGEIVATLTAEQVMIGYNQVTFSLTVPLEASLKMIEVGVLFIQLWEDA